VKRVVIIGGGISGLTAAYLFANSEEYEVHIVEKSSQLGGLLKSFDYGKQGRFDYGAHNILETGIKELDDFYYNLLPKGKWQTTTTINGQRRALTGLMYSKKLQENSPFIDLLNHEKLSEYIGDFFQNLNENKGPFSDIYKQDAYSYSVHLFGSKISDEIIVPAIKKLYGRHPKELNTMVMFLTQFTRIGLLEENVMSELVHTKEIGSRLGFTNQLNLPKKYLTHFQSWYPKEYGIYRVIDAIEEQLIEKGVVFHKNSTVTQVHQNNQIIEKVVINEKEYLVDELVCSVGQYPLGLLLDVDMSRYSFDAHPKTIITNMLIDKSLTCGELSFIYSYDEGTKVFRIDNYINYCEGAKQDNLYRVSIESVEFGEIDEKEFQEKLIAELKEYSIMSDDTNISFIQTEILENGFPLLTQNNVFVVNDLRDRIGKLQIQNVTNIGILSEEGLFFESDVIKDAYLKIRSILEKGDEDGTE
jgi:protoporphyrinogen oxidase